MTSWLVTSPDGVTWDDATKLDDLEATDWGIASYWMVVEAETSFEARLEASGYRVVEDRDGYALVAA